MSLHLMPGAAALFAMTMLAGCASSAVPPSNPSPPPLDCGAAALQDKIGQPVTGSSAADAQVGGVPVQSRGDVRVIAPGQAVIQNYSDARLNLETDATGKLVRATCG